MDILAIILVTGLALCLWLLNEKVKKLNKKMIENEKMWNGLKEISDRCVWDAIKCNARAIDAINRKLGDESLAVFDDFDYRCNPVLKSDFVKSSKSEPKS